MDDALGLNPELLLDLQIQQRLLARGLLSEIRFPNKGVPSPSEGQLAEVKGKPVSETIIEERR